MTLSKSTLSACEEKLRLTRQREEILERMQVLTWPGDMTEHNGLLRQKELINQRLRIVSRGIEGPWQKYRKSMSNST